MIITATRWSVKTKAKRMNSRNDANDGTEWVSIHAGLGLMFRSKSNGCGISICIMQRTIQHTFDTWKKRDRERKKNRRLVWILNFVHILLLIGNSYEKKNMCNNTYHFVAWFILLHMLCVRCTHWEDERRKMQREIESKIKMLHVSKSVFFAAIRSASERATEKRGTKKRPRKTTVQNGRIMEERLQRRRRRTKETPYKCTSIDTCEHAEHSFHWIWEAYALDS